MKPYSAMTAPELLDLVATYAERLQSRLVEIPSDFDHHGEMFEADAEELRDLTAYISEQAADICLDRMREPPTVEDGPLPPPVDTYSADRSIDPMELRN